MSVCTELGYALNLGGAKGLTHTLEFYEGNEWPQPEHSVRITDGPGWGELESFDVVELRPRDSPPLYTRLKLRKYRGHLCSQQSHTSTDNSRRVVGRRSCPLPCAQLAPSTSP